MKSRLVLILMGLTFLWSAMIGRAVYLQLVPDTRLENLQKRQFETVVTLNPRRGDVLDRNGHELAVSAPSYSIFVDPKILEEPKRTVRALAKILNETPHSIEEKIRNHKKRFVWIDRGLKREVRDQVAALKVRGIGFVEESKRIYPNERLLANVLGYVGQDGKGLEGLEMKFNETLEAAKKRVSVRRDARGRPLIVNGQLFNQVPDGSDVVLTIDREVQFILEQELAQAVVKHEADAAVGVVLDAQTSEVVAMASAPSFDPNHPEKFPAAFKRNRVVQDSFEPGSTMKTFVLAGAIHKGLITPDTKVDCEGGVIHIGKHTIHEADAKHQFHLITTTQILQYSSNTGMTKVAFKVGQDAVRDSYRMFGFGERTGIDLPGEAKGIMQPFPWRDHLLANISFGHGLTATPLQIANAYAVIANGGFLRKPYIVKEIRDHENSETTATQAKTLSRVLTIDDVAKMRKMLLAVTTKEGTGYNARVAGYPVAGKTGTAQKVNPNGRGYLKGGFVSSFAGFIPANNPKYVIYIAIDHPRKDHFGGSVAAPVFSRVASFAVRRAGIAPSLGPEDSALPLLVPIMNLTQDSVEPTLEGSEVMPISALLEMGKKNEDSMTAGSAAAAVAGTAQLLPPWQALSDALDEDKVLKDAAKLEQGGISETSARVAKFAAKLGENRTGSTPVAIPTALPSALATALPTAAEREAGVRSIAGHAVAGHAVAGSGSSDADILTGAAHVGGGSAIGGAGSAPIALNRAGAGPGAFQAGSSSATISQTGFAHSLSGNLGGNLFASTSGAIILEPKLSGESNSASNRITVGSSLPDLTGMSLREVLTRVSGTQVDVRVHGQGFVTKSLPAAGSKMAGNRLTIYLSEPE